MSSSAPTASGGDRLSGQLDWLRYVESMDEATAQRRLRSRLRSEAALARSEIRPLRPWPSMPATARQMLERDGEIVRLHRLVRAVPAGARILDVGCGPGLVGGTLARHGRIGAYLGVDLSRPRIESAREMATVNELGGEVRFEIGDATDLPSDLVDDLGPDTVLILEVLEHLQEPATVLAAIADTVPVGARIIFSVPILGRIEACWGHRTLFGADAVVGLAGAAGVELLDVDEVHDTWAVATVARDGGGHRPAVGVDPVRIDHRTARQFVVRGGDHTVLEEPSRLAVTLAPRSTVTVEARTPGADWVRVDLAVTAGPEPHVEVVTLDADDEPVRRWVPDLDRLAPAGRTTIVVRPGDAHTPGAAPAGEVATTRIVLTATRRTTAVEVWRVGFATGYAGLRPGSRGDGGRAGRLRSSPGVARTVRTLRRLGRRLRRLAGRLGRRTSS